MSDSSPTYENQIYLDPDLTKKTGHYKTVVDIFVEAASAFRKVDRRSITEVAEKFVKIKRLGSRSGPWSRDRTPYMVLPQNLLSSRELGALIFCGPAQSGKTESLILNFIAYSVIQDPMDMILYNPSQKNARDFSVRRVDRLNLSPAMRQRLMRTKAGDNKETKIYSSGMLLALSWPTVSKMAGKPAGRIMLTDYDRMDDNVGDEGSPVDLAFMRTTTFGSLAMTVAESSPSRPVTDPRWIPNGHEAPPTTGILALYNRGDRRRWYWPHMKCGEYFEGNFSHLKWDDKENALDAADTVRMMCPVCGGAILPSERPTMQEYGIWLKDGQYIDKNGDTIGDGPRSYIASFWLKGVAAGFQSWQQLVVKYINATREYERTGSEESLRDFYNISLGEPYRSKAEELERLPEMLQSRAETLEPGIVPEGVRFLVASIDVQKSRFVVQVHGIGPGVPFDITVVDRWKIDHSHRLDDEGHPQWIRPATYQEDWDRIVDDVMLKSYELSDGSGRRMTIKLTVCDSGGQDGVTGNAYEFYRGLRKRGLANRFHLVKGDGRINAPRARLEFPDQARKDKLAIARGDVPVLFLNSNVLKDSLANRLDSVIPGKGMIRFPNWLPDWFFKELCAERRTDKGWVNTQGNRNESWDLLYYCIGVCAFPPLLPVERIDWSKPPAWADEWNRNPLVLMPAASAQSLTQATSSPRLDFAELGKALA